ncbi:MAG: queuosine precursor transporter [Myxococcaceae bacterium]
MSEPQRDPARNYRYFDFLVGAFVAVLLCSNLIGPGKTIGFTMPVVGSVTFGVGNLFFPVAYIFGDLFTEVYGFAHARRAIWAGFAGMVFAAVMSVAVIHLPPEPTEPFNRTIQPALEIVFGNTWRIVLGSLIAFWAGDFVNSFVLAKMKVIMQGKALWARTIGSTVVGQLVDSAIFYPVAFLGVWSATTVVKVVVFNWLLKVLVEALFTPLTYLIVNWVKRAEGEDYFDTKTDFTPFSLRD